MVIENTTVSIVSLVTGSLLEPIESRFIYRVPVYVILGVTAILDASGRF